MEVEKLINDHTILFLTETQQKLDTTIWNSSYKKYINMRDKQSKKGGGLMIVHNNNQAYTELEQVDTKQEDILILRGTLKSMKVSIILIYLSVIRGATERKSNQGIMTEIRRGISRCDDDELVFIMGDFNAHVGIIGEQELNYNGKIVLDIMTENNMIMLNDTDKCKGTYTWSRGQSKSVMRIKFSFWNM